jgi:hypothetical protein
MNSSFYVLALSQKEVRLLHGSQQTASNMTSENIPQGISNMSTSEKEKNLQFHTKTSSRSGKRKAMFHGHGAGNDDSNSVITEYFRNINKEVLKIIGDDAPLFLAAVDYLHPLYRKVNSYQNLQDQGVLGNPEEFSDAELVEKASELHKPLVEDEIRNSFSEYMSLKSSGMASSEDKTIIKAAYQGRIKTLFLDNETTCYGRFDEDSHEVVCQAENDNEREHEDLSNFAALYTLLNKGKVFPFSHDHDSKTKMAAVFRY